MPLMKYRKWSERVSDLSDYKSKYGHTNVPMGYKNDKSLAVWVNFQRQEYRKYRRGEKCSMTSARMSDLNDLGFEWDPLSAAWSARLNELETFRKEHGHCNVPRTYKSNPGLARWVVRQREDMKLQRNGQTSGMTRERERALERMGFVWSVAGAANAASARKGIAALDGAQHKEEGGSEAEGVQSQLAANHSLGVSSFSDSALSAAASWERRIAMLHSVHRHQPTAAAAELYHHRSGTTTMIPREQAAGMRAEMPYHYNNGSMAQRMHQMDTAMSAAAISMAHAFSPRHDSPLAASSKQHKQQDLMMLPPLVVPAIVPPDAATTVPPMSEGPTLLPPAAFPPARDYPPQLRNNYLMTATARDNNRLGTTEAEIRMAQQEYQMLKQEHQMLKYSSVDSTGYVGGGELVANYFDEKLQKLEEQQRYYSMMAEKEEVGSGAASSSSRRSEMLRASQRLRQRIDEARALARLRRRRGAIGRNPTTSAPAQYSSPLSRGCIEEERLLPLPSSMALGGSPTMSSSSASGSAPMPMPEPHIATAALPAVMRRPCRDEVQSSNAMSMMPRAGRQPPAEGSAGLLHVLANVCAAGEKV